MDGCSLIVPGGTARIARKDAEPSSNVFNTIVFSPI